MRRTFVSSPAVVATAAAVIASSTTYDPILTAIERYSVACDVLETIDQRDEPARYATAEYEVIATGEALFATPPQTIKGAKALADFVLEDIGLGHEDDWACRALASLSEALPRLAGQTTA